jgi:hypothetical protein
VAAVTTFTFPGNTILVYNNFGICPNSVGANSIGTEFNGSFGSGRPRNRAASLNVPAGYTYSTFTSNAPNDYFYGIANNTSTNTGYTTLNTWAKPDLSAPTHRVFQVWDIIGDHTGAASPTLGNPAADTVANGNAGYMLVINAAYRIDSAFQQTISNLCPNTYYEISCWMRNICSKCGCDSNGIGNTGAGYIPTGAGDSSGVTPNLTFDVDGVDYYTTGDIKYTGQWIKKGFTILTGPLQTSFTLKFFNNAPGGGGNDWALDDITVATCTPNLTLLPSANPTVCAANVVNMSCVVKCFFNNYTYYKWQKSTDGGVVWVDDGLPGGPASPTWSGSDWQYTVNHPAFVATMADSATKFRIVIATTLANLGTANCSFSDATVITLKVIDCSTPLGIQLLSFTGNPENGHAKLHWSTSREIEPLQFIVEKSIDGATFNTIATLANHNNMAMDVNGYEFPDPNGINGVIYYRIKMENRDGRYEYSRIIKMEGKTMALSFGAVINPFRDDLSFEIVSPQNSRSDLTLVSMDGITIRKMTVVLNPGFNNIHMPAASLQRGIYTLQVNVRGMIMQRMVVKQ